MAGRTGWTRLDLDLGKAGTMLRDYAGPCEGDPEQAVVFCDRRKRFRRISARYAGGWALQVNFGLDGKVSSYSLALSMRLVAKK